MEGMHDIYICAKTAAQNGNTKFTMSVTESVHHIWNAALIKIACIVESDIVDHVRNLNPPDENSIKNSWLSC